MRYNLQFNFQVSDGQCHYAEQWYGEYEMNKHKLAAVVQQSAGRTVVVSALPTRRNTPIMIKPDREGFVNHVEHNNSESTISNVSHNHDNVAMIGSYVQPTAAAVIISDDDSVPNTCWT